MELNPKLRLRRPIEVPFSNPKRITVCPSIAFGSKKCKRCATWRVQKVIMRCQLVNVVAKGKPRVLMRALLQMTMATDDATDSARDPITPSWNPDDIIICYCYLLL